MWKRGRKTGVLLAVLVCLWTGVASAQEGSLHKVFRYVVAIPRALLDSLNGPGTYGTYGTMVNGGTVPPYTIVTSQPYSAVAPTAVIQMDPAYVTYNAVVTVNNAGQSLPPNSYVYDPVPFDTP